METEKVLNFSCEMGRQLLQNGAEIYRVEESIHRLLAAYGCQQIEVFAIPSCIILNIQEGEHNYTKSVRIKGASIDGKTYLKAGKKVTLLINGRIYTAKTNSKGKATFNIKLTKKGKFTAKISFAGDVTYKSTTKKVKITIK